MELPDSPLVARFSADLDALIGGDERIGLAVSGGPDSLALLLLAAAARPGSVEAASIDHRLRPESASEASMVASVCEALSVHHVILPLEWDRQPRSNLQATARWRRYKRLAGWARDRRLGAVATGHHADDQAETLMMRLARGSGLSGLAGIRAAAEILPGLRIIRPLLRWRRSELATIVTKAGLKAADDPSNRDPRHDRTEVRKLLESEDWGDPVRIAESAAHLAQAEEALQWVSARLASERLTIAGKTAKFMPEGLPAELQRRLLLKTLEQLGAKAPTGPEISRALEALRAGRAVTLAGFRLQAGECWHLSPAPARR